MEGSQCDQEFSKREPGQGVWWTEVPQEGPEQSPVEGPEDEVPQKLKQNVKLVYSF